jgi:hypothetical protein
MPSPRSKESEPPSHECSPVHPEIVLRDACQYGSIPGYWEKLPDFTFHHEDLTVLNQVGEVQ